MLFLTIYISNISDTNKITYNNILYIILITITIFQCLALYLPLDHGITRLEFLPLSFVSPTMESCGDSRVTKAMKRKNVDVIIYRISVHIE